MPCMAIVTMVQNVQNESLILVCLLVKEVALKQSMNCPSEMAVKE